MQNDLSLKYFSYNNFNISLYYYIIKIILPFANNFTSSP